MSTAEDRFIAGDGPLVALIRAQPSFEAPPRMLGRILAALDAAPATAGFEPPASLMEAVMAEADRIDAAQAPRREALMAELAAGKAADDVLGAKLSPATAEWLATRQPKPAASPPPGRRRWPWLAGLGTAVTAALTVSVALRMVQEPATPPPMPAVMSAPAPAESRAESLPGSTAGTADTAIAYAPGPQATERLAKAEAPPARTAGAGESHAQEREAKRTAARPARPPTTMADAAPAAPAAGAPMMAEALRSAPAPSARMRAEAEADDAMAPEALIDVTLDTPPASLAERLLAHPAQAWTMTVAPSDETTGNALRAALAAHLDAVGRDDPIEVRVGSVAPGRIRVTGNE